MTTGTRFQYHLTLDTRERRAEFQRQDRQERYVLWFGFAMGVLTVAAWIVALV